MTEKVNGVSSEGSPFYPRLTKKNACIAVLLVTAAVGLILWILGHDYGKVLVAIGLTGAGGGMLHSLREWCCTSTVEVRTKTTLPPPNHREEILKIKDLQGKINYAIQNGLNILISTKTHVIRIQRGAYAYYAKNVFLEMVGAFEDQLREKECDFMIECD